MSLLIGLLDDDKNTDVIIHINYKSKTMTWIPRDLYSHRILHKINSAYRYGGNLLFKKCVEDLGFGSIIDCICIPIKSCRKVFSSLEVYVEIQEQADYYYPIRIGRPIEEGRKIISFSPPGELLKGERIHQFLGARTRVKSTDYTDLPDFERIKRQQSFMRALIRDKFKFKTFFNHEIDASATELIKFFNVFKSPYEYHLFNPSLYDRKLGKMLVLLPRKDKINRMISLSPSIFRKILRIIRVSILKYQGN